MRKFALVLAATAAVAVPLAVTTTGTSSAQRHCYTLGVPGFDHYEYCTELPIDPRPTTVTAEPQVPGLPEVPDPTDCHSVQRFFHVQNVVSCDGPPTS